MQQICEKFWCYLEKINFSIILDHTHGKNVPCGGLFLLFFPNVSTVFGLSAPFFHAAYTTQCKNLLVFRLFCTHLSIGVSIHHSLKYHGSFFIHWEFPVSTTMTLKIMILVIFRFAKHFHAQPLLL